MMLVMVCGSLSSFNPGSAGVPDTGQRAGNPTQAVSCCQRKRLDLGTYLPYPLANYVFGQGGEQDIGGAYPNV